MTNETNKTAAYNQMLVGVGLIVGDQVRDDQGEVGTIEMPTDDPAKWNGSHSELQFCLDKCYVRVRYENGNLLQTPLERIEFHASQKVGN